jgi:tetratricopeptide (TPR) repeat protein
MKAASPTQSFLVERADLVAIGCVAMLGLVVRFAFLSQARACPLFDYLIVDGRAYNDWADRIAAGDWAGDRVFYQAPLYPYFLAIIKTVFGSATSSIRAVQAVLGALTCGALFLAGRMFVGRAAGLAAGVMLALYPPAIFFDAIIQKAGLGSFLTAILLVALAAIQLRPSAWKTACAGCVLGLLAITREESLLLAPVLLTWLWLCVLRSNKPPQSGRLAACAAFVAGLMLPLSIVATRNYQVGGEWVLTTSQAGPNFFIGNNPGATGMYAPLRPGRSDTSKERLDAVELAEQACGKQLSSGEVSHYWLGQAFDFIWHQPGAWLPLVMKKAALLLNAYEVPDAENQYFYEEYSPLLRTLSRVWHFGVLVPAAVIGIVLGRRRKLDQSAPIVMIATLSAAVIAFYVFGRYRFTLVQPLMLLAGAGVTEAFGLLCSRRWRALATPGLAAMGAAIVSNWPIHARDHHMAESFSNAGGAAADAGDDLRAIELNRQALRLNPALPDTIYNLALSTGRVGQVRDAIPLLRDALRLRPDDPRFEMLLGTALAESGETAEAIQHLERAVFLAPQDLDSRTNYRMLLEGQARWREAIEQARAIAALRPDDSHVLGDLARLLATCPVESLRDVAAAVQAAETAVRLDGRQDAELLIILANAYAEAGQFDAAMTAATAARQRADALGLAPLMKQIDEHLQRLRERRSAPAP